MSRRNPSCLTWLLSSPVDLVGVASLLALPGLLSVNVGSTHWLVLPGCLSLHAPGRKVVFFVYHGWDRLVSGVLHLLVASPVRLKVFLKISSLLAREALVVKQTLVGLLILLYQHVCLVKLVLKHLDLTHLHVLRGILVEELMLLLGDLFSE